MARARLGAARYRLLPATAFLPTKDDLHHTGKRISKGADYTELAPAAIVLFTVVVEGLPVTIGLLSRCARVSHIALRWGCRR